MMRRRALPFTAALLVSVQPAAGVEGPRIVDPAGEPVPDARVEVVAEPTGGDLLSAATAPSWEVHTDDQGRLGLRLPTGRKLLVAVDHPDFEPRLEAFGAPLPDSIALAPGAVLRGRITKPSRQGWTGEVCARWQTGAAQWHRRFSWSRCGPLSEEGSFQLRGAPSEPVNLVVAPAGFLPARLEAKPGEPVEVAVERGELLRGTVRSSAGALLPGARVLHGEETEALSDEEGRFVLPVPGVPTSLRVECEGFAPVEHPVARIDPDRPLVVVLQPVQRLSGHVVSRTGSNVDEVSISLDRRTEAGLRRSQHRVRLEDGELDLPVEEAGTYTVRIGARGHREETFPGVELAPGERYELGVVELSAGAVVRGALLDARSGEGIEGATARILPRGEKVFKHLAEGKSLTAITGEDGSFEIRGADPGDYELTLESADHAPGRHGVELTEDEPVDLGRLYLEPGTRVRGHVVDRRGESLTGATVRFFEAARESLLPLSEANTRGDGTFSGATLAPGTYRVEVTRERLLLSQAVEIPDVEDHEIELVTGGTELRGVVVRAGEPMPGGLLVIDSEADPGLNGTGKVVVRGAGAFAGQSAVYGLPRATARAEVGRDGTFSIPDAPVGAVTATYYDPAGPPVVRRLEVPDRPTAWVEVDLGGAELAGRIVDEATGLGIRATVELLGRDGRTVAAKATGGDGFFRVQDLAPGRYAARVAAEGYRTELVDPVHVRTDGDSLNVALNSAATGSLQISLHRSDQSPLAGVFVSVVDAAGTTLRSLLSDQAGSRRYDDLSPGLYHVVWSDPGVGVGVSPPLEVTGGETTRWEGALPQGSPVTIACDPSACGEQPLDHLLLFSADTGVELSRFLGGLSPGARFGPDGRLPLGSLSSGRYVLYAGVGGRGMEVEIDVPTASSLLVGLRGGAGGSEGIDGAAGGLR